MLYSVGPAYPIWPCCKSEEMVEVVDDHRRMGVTNIVAICCSTKLLNAVLAHQTLPSREGAHLHHPAGRSLASGPCKRSCAGGGAPTLR